MRYAVLGDSELSGLPPALEALVRDELAEGEKPAWAGRPRVGRMVLGSLPMFVFGIFFFGFAAFWTGGAYLVGGPMALFGLLFLGVGLGMLASPLWAGYKASRTCYALTSRRAITWEPEIGAGLRVRSYRPEDLRSLVRNQRGDGSGDLIFEEVTSYGHKGRRHVTRRGFLAIDDVRGVENLIRSTLLRD